MGKFIITSKSAIRSVNFINNKYFAIIPRNSIHYMKVVLFHLGNIFLSPISVAKQAIFSAKVAIIRQFAPAERQFPWGQILILDKLTRPSR